MDDVRSQFAGVPLFDQTLNDELLALERRQAGLQGSSSVAQQQQGSGLSRFFPIGGSSNNGRGGGYPGELAVTRPTAMYPQATPAATRSNHSPLSVNLSPSSTQSPAPAALSTLRSRELLGRPSDATFALPPKIMRPWSVEVLMRRGEAASANLRHSQFDGDAQRAPLQSRLTHRRGGVRSRGERGDHTFTNEREDAASAAVRFRRDGKHGNSPNAADNSSPDDEYMRGSAGYGGSRPQHPSDTFLHGEEPLTTAVEHIASELFEDLDDLTLNEQIERAATRRRIQHDRLEKLGLHPPGMVLASQQQTNARELRFEPDAHGVPSSTADVDLTNVQELLARIATASASHASVGTGSSPPSRSQHVGRQSHHSKAPLVLDAAGYQEYAMPTEAAAGDTIWRRMLMEEKNPASRKSGAPSAYALVKQSTAGTQPSEAARRPVGGSMQQRRELPVSHDPSRVHSTQPDLMPSMFETKTALMRQLDQMQLSNEEMLVRNKIVSLDSATDEYRSHGHRALDHVAAAQRSAAAAMAVPPPEGGYLSVADRLAHEEVAPRQQPYGGAEGTSDRWNTASLGATYAGAVGNSTSGTFARDGGVAAGPLRRWATDHSNLVPSTVHQSALPKPRIGGTAQGGGFSNFVHAPNAADNGYDARKKWAGVSFQQEAAADPYGGGGYQYYGGAGGGPADRSRGVSHLEALSQAANNFMHPDPTPFYSP